MYLSIRVLLRVFALFHSSLIVQRGGQYAIPADLADVVQKTKNIQGQSVAGQRVKGVWPIDIISISRLVSLSWIICYVGIVHVLSGAFPKEVIKPIQQ